jgi:hypothetical protein
LRIEGKEIDPAPRSAVADLDFSRHEPTCRRQPLLGVDRAPRMDEVDLARLDERRIDGEVVANAHAGEELVDRVQPNVVRDPSFDPADQRLGNP